MRLQQISPYGYLLTHNENYNAFLVRQEMAFTLIDTTMPGTADDMITELKKVSVGIEVGLGEILITHGHLDHVGGLDELVERLPSIPLIAAAEREDRLLRRPVERGTDRGEPASEVRGNFPGLAHPPTKHLHDGERVGALRCVFSPGHTPGHMSFFDQRDGTLYAGDALITHGGRPHVCGFGPPDFPGPVRGTWHPGTAQASVEAMQLLAIERVACGHGPVLEGPQLISQALSDALRSGPIPIA